jgi:DivIVA domain-containing protein
MGQLMLLLVAALVVAGIGFGVVVLITGSDPGLAAVEPDGRSVPLPGGRPLVEADVDALRFDTAFRGYRMSQVDGALRRTAYDLGYKEELITVLMAEVDALRAGRLDDAELLRQVRDQALAAARPAPVDAPAIVVPGAGGDTHAEVAEVLAAKDEDADVRAGADEAAAARTEPSERNGDPPDWSVELEDLPESTTGRR